MYGNTGIQQYQQTDISSMSKEKMIVLLYEKIVTDLESARRAIGEDNRLEMTKKINHSQRIVSELRGALDHAIGGEISLNLESLYDFMFHEHLESLLDQDEKHIDNCLQVLIPLLDAWRSIPTGTGEKAEKALTTDAVGPEGQGPYLNAAAQIFRGLQMFSVGIQKFH